MKTLVNKANPDFRITAQEIIEEEEYYTLDGEIVYLKEYWTLVEEEPEFEHRRKDTIYFLETAKTHYADTSELEKCIEWLKGLQPTEGIKGNLEEIPSNVDLEKEIRKHTDLFQADIEYPLRLTAIKFYELGRKGGRE